MFVEEIASLLFKCALVMELDPKKYYLHASKLPNLPNL